MLRIQEYGVSEIEGTHVFVVILYVLVMCQIKLQNMSTFNDFKLKIWTSLSEVQNIYLSDSLN